MAYIYIDDSNYNVKIYCIRVRVRHLRIIDFIAVFGLTIYLNLKWNVYSRKRMSIKERTTHVVCVYVCVCVDFIAIIFMFLLCSV